MAAIAGFDMVIIDPRGSMISPATFGTAALFAEQPEDVFQAAAS